MGYILGLDLGSNSIGWACIDPKKKQIIAVGSRVFKEGVNRDNKGGEVSKNTKQFQRDQMLYRQAGKNM